MIDLLIKAVVVIVVKLPACSHRMIIAHISLPVLFLQKQHQTESTSATTDCYGVYAWDEEPRAGVTRAFCQSSFCYLQIGFDRVVIVLANQNLAKLDLAPLVRKEVEAPSHAPLPCLEDELTILVAWLELYRGLVPLTDPAEAK